MRSPGLPAPRRAARAQRRDMADPDTKPDDTKPDTTSGQGLSGIVTQMREDITDLRKTIKEQEAPRKEISEQQIQGMQDLQKKYMDLAGKGGVPNVPIPKLQAIPQPPEQKYADPVQAYGNPLVVLATIGSLFTRTPAIAALQTGAAAMNGFHEGQAEKFELERENFQNKIRTVVAQNQQEVQLYDMVMQKAQLSVSDRMAQMSAVAHAFQNTAMIAAARNGDMDSVVKLKTGIVQAQSDLMGMVEKQDQWQATLEERKIYHEGVLESKREAMRQKVAGYNVQKQGDTAAAKAMIEKLEAGESVDYGGVIITPKDFKEFPSVNKALRGYTGTQIAIEKLTKAAQGTLLEITPTQHGPGQITHAPKTQKPIPLPPELRDRLAEGQQFTDHETGITYFRQGDLGIPLRPASAPPISG
jgi:hypothetical protein